MNIRKKNKMIHGKADIANIWLDKYEEIFSDFDPSPVAMRTVSDDFINETKKICREKKLTLQEFNIFLPSNIRIEADEISIAKRLHSYFQKKLQQYNVEYKNTRRKGIVFAFFGIILLMLLTYLLSLQIFPAMLQAVFIVIEPAGWFLIWMGLDYIFFVNKTKSADREFYKKIGKAAIKFHSTPEQTYDLKPKLIADKNHSFN